MDEGNRDKDARKTSIGSCMECKSISSPSTPTQSPDRKSPLDMTSNESAPRPTVTFTTEAMVEEAMNSLHAFGQDQHKNATRTGGTSSPATAASASDNLSAEFQINTECDRDNITNNNKNNGDGSSTTNSNKHLPNTCGNSETPIKDFYRNATILITGGTGFVGKVLIQKLLRTFEVRRIYMLIRCKNNMTVEQRLQEYFTETIFDTIREQNPELFEKVHPIRANFNAIDLDITPTDRELLSNEVAIVFNVVASVKFNEKLSDAIGINVLGTNKILDLAMEMKHLKSFVHISTLYCNCNRKHIKEKVYETEIGYEKIMQISRIFDDETLEKFRPCLIGEMPNTYTMTKKCAENLVNHKAFHLPAGIFRPPIVMSTYQDPIPGWTDNLYGPSGLCTWSARGLVRCIYGNAKCKANMVPADYCVNAMISCAWDVARRYELSKRDKDHRRELPVYNYIFERNNLTWGQYMHLSRKGFHEPFDKVLWCFSYIIIPWKPLHYAASIVLHHLPAYILDLIALVTGQKRIYIKAYAKITKIIYMMSWFGLKHWSFANRNVTELDELLTGKEKQYLQFNISTINWTDYFRSYLSGIRRYVFKDKENKLEKRKTFYRRILFLHNLLKTSVGITLIMYLVKLYFKIFKVIPKMKF